MIRFFIFIAFLSFATAEESATVSKVRGNPKRESSTGWQVLKVGDKVKDHEKLKTLNKELLVLKLAKGGKVVLFGNSELSLEEKAKGKKRTLIQDKGNSWIKLKKLKKQESFAIKTPTAVAGVRGTAFNTRVEGG